MHIYVTIAASGSPNWGSHLSSHLHGDLAASVFSARHKKMHSLRYFFILATVTAFAFATVIRDDVEGRYTPEKLTRTGE